MRARRSGAVSDEVSRRLLDELALLRMQTERDSGLLAAIVDSSDDAIISKNLTDLSRAGIRVQSACSVIRLRKLSVST